MAAGIISDSNPLDIDLSSTTILNAMHRSGSYEHAGKHKVPVKVSVRKQATRHEVFIRCSGRFYDLGNFEQRIRFRVEIFQYLPDWFYARINPFVFAVSISK
jgi:hypothetical protein